MKNESGAKASVFRQFFSAATACAGVVLSAQRSRFGLQKLLDIWQCQIKRQIRKKPAIFSVAGFLLPMRLVVAPRPGLEPGTYGLTVELPGFRAGLPIITFPIKSSTYANSTELKRTCQTLSEASIAIICAIKSRLTDGPEFTSREHCRQGIKVPESVFSSLSKIAFKPGLATPSSFWHIPKVLSGQSIGGAVTHRRLDSSCGFHPIETKAP